jgi:hypothetical protein
MIADRTNTFLFCFNIFYIFVFDNGSVGTRSEHKEFLYIGLSADNVPKDVNLIVFIGRS